MKSILLFSLSIILLSACANLAPIPDVPEVPEKVANESWATVLKQHVDSEGRVNFGAIENEPKNLKQYVRFVSSVKKGELTDSNVRLAFYLNAYNALSMYNVIISEFPQDLDGFFKRLRFFYNRKFIIMGEEMSLYAFENDLVRAEGDPRVHVALNCMSAGCPRLPREPFTAKDLDKQLDREAKKFFNEEGNVRVDDKEKIVYISEILDFFTEDFLKKAKSLNEYVNLYRNAKVPLDYKVKFIPYNWTIYRQPNTK